MSNKARILVTGASGFLGSELLRELEAHFYDVVSLTKRGVGRANSITGDITLPGDWQNEVRTGGFTHLFHLAGCNKADDPSNFYKINVEGTRNLFDALRGSSVSWRLVASSGAVYGKQPDDLFPISETVAPEPLGDYAVSKLQQEKLATTLSRDVGVEKLCIVRISNLIGPGSSNEFFLGRIVEMVRRLAKGPTENRVLELGCLEGTRDFLDVRDAAKALIKMMGVKACGTYNLGSGVEYSLHNIVDEVVKLGGVEGMRVVEDKSRFKSVIKRQVLDISALVKLAGWRPQIALKSSIRDMLNA
ncbi:MAG: NAD(P)-dependent oxidoreductase [bacterium]|nr:NAD(P)-dependent oxidoreductase [bacterium]